MQTNHYLSGFRFAYENARCLFDAAVALEEKKQYAIANSLLVLSAEEGVKAYAIFGKYLYGDFLDEVDLNYFERAFEDHKHKLDAIRGIVATTYFFGKMNELFYLPMINNAITPVKDFAEFKARCFAQLIAFLEKDTRGKNSEIKKQTRWWKHAKTLKESGFYVGYHGGKWATPSVIKRTQYAQTKKYVQTFISGVELFYELDFTDEEVQQYFNELTQITIESYRKALAEAEC